MHDPCPTVFVAIAVLGHALTRAELELRTANERVVVPAHSDAMLEQRSHQERTAKALVMQQQRGDWLRMSA